MRFLDPGSPERQALRDRIVFAEARLGRLEALLDEVQSDIRELERRPTPDDDTGALRDSIQNLVESHHDQDERVRKLDEYVLQRLDTLTLAMAEGIERVTRSERRVNATVSRARKELATHGYESPGLEAEAAELQPIDGEGGGEGGVPAVPADVVEPLEQPRGIPGTVSQKLLKVLRA